MIWFFEPSQRIALLATEPLNRTADSKQSFIDAFTIGQPSLWHSTDFVIEFAGFVEREVLIAQKQGL